MMYKKYTLAVSPAQGYTGLPAPLIPLCCLFLLLAPAANFPSGVRSVDDGAEWVKIVTFPPSGKELSASILGRVELGSVVHSYGWRGRDDPVDLGYQKHFRMAPGTNEFASKHSHINPAGQKTRA
ncbi:MAG: hypothetical protein J1E80_00165 [Desulfovibrionaceae bacterium]|nr:hypothetical protein [Desulfovibrionaceae bacterium]